MQSKKKSANQTATKCTQFKPVSGFQLLLITLYKIEKKSRVHAYCTHASQLTANQVQFKQLACFFFISGFYYFALRRLGPHPRSLTVIAVFIIIHFSFVTLIIYYAFIFKHVGNNIQRTHTKQLITTTLEANGV